MTKLRIGLAGYGVAGRAMVPSILQHPRFELVAVADRLMPGPPDIEHFHEVEAMCDDHSIEVVYVGTPTEFHADHAVAALRMGMHVIVEKPMALVLHECDDMIGAAASRRAALVVGPTQAFEPGVQELAHRVRQGEIGRVHRIEARHVTDWFRRRDRAGQEHVVLRQGAHHVDMVREITGQEIVSVDARTSATGYDASLSFADGSVAHIAYDGDRPEAAGDDPARAATFGDLTVTGERGELQLSAGGLTLRQGGDATPIPLGHRPDGRTALLDELFDAVFQDREPRHDGFWGRSTVAVCLAMLSSAAEGRAVTLTD